MSVSYNSNCQTPPKVAAERVEWRSPFLRYSWSLPRYSNRCQLSVQFYRQCAATHQLADIHHHAHISTVFQHFFRMLSLRLRPRKFPLNPQTRQPATKRPCSSPSMSLNELDRCLPTRTALAKDRQPHRPRSHPQVLDGPTYGPALANAASLQQLPTAAPSCRRSRTQLCMSGLRPRHSASTATARSYDARGALKPARTCLGSQTLRAGGLRILHRGKILHRQLRTNPWRLYALLQDHHRARTHRTNRVPKEVDKASIWDVGIYPKKEENLTPTCASAKWTRATIAKPVKAGRPRRRLMPCFLITRTLPAVRLLEEVVRTRADPRLKSAARKNARVKPRRLGPISLTHHSHRVGRRPSPAQWVYQTIGNLRMLRPRPTGPAEHRRDGMNSLGEVSIADKSEQMDRAQHLIASSHSPTRLALARRPTSPSRPVARR